MITDLPDDLALIRDRYLDQARDRGWQVAELTHDGPGTVHVLRQDGKPRHLVTAGNDRVYAQDLAWNPDPDADAATLLTRVVAAVRLNRPPVEPGTARTDTDFHKCTVCGYVTGPLPQPPGGCISCRRAGVAFTAISVTYPARPSDQALDSDTRDLEATIRATYARLAERPGAAVPLADLRAALPTGLDRDTIDAALIKLAGHTGVHIIPTGSQKQVRPDTQQAALDMGGQYNHTLYIEPNPSLTDTLQVITSTSRVRAESILAALDDRAVAWLADRMGVATDGSPVQLRDRVAERAAHNRRQWLANARQGREDGTLLYRADNEPEWVASWTATDREQVAAAAARLQHRAATEDSWAFVRERADRWAAATTPAA